MRLAAALLLASLALAGAAPAFDPDDAVAWIDKTTKTGVPKEERIYSIGPETRVEADPTGQTPPRPVAVRRVLSAKEVRSVAGVGLLRFGKMPLTIRVYRAGGLAFQTGDARSEFSLVAGDVVVARLGNP